MTIRCSVLTLALLVGCSSEEATTGSPSRAAVRTLIVGENVVCTLDTQSVLRCWGKPPGVFAPRLGGAAGEMAKVAPVDLGAPIKAVSAESNSACALLTDNSVKCWGNNPSGVLGLGDKTVREFPNQLGAALPRVPLGAPVREVSVGTMHACALLEGGSIKCWGRNVEGQLGQGDTEDRGDAPGEIEALGPVKLPAGRTAVHVDAGGNHTCAILDDGSVRCWGDGDDGILGIGSQNDVGRAPTDMGDALMAVSLGTGRTAKEVVALGDATCALLDDGTVKCWGNSNLGVVGQGKTRDAVGDAPGELGDALPPIALAAKVKHLTAGSGHVCVLLEDSTVQCWGYNAQGQLGLGDVRSRGIAPGDMGAALPRVDVGGTVVELASGGNNSCVLLADGRVKCWGYNLFGQLGVEDTNNRGDQPGEMGSALAAAKL